MNTSKDKLTKKLSAAYLKKLNSITKLMCTDDSIGFLPYLLTYLEFIRDRRILASDFRHITSQTDSAAPDSTDFIFTDIFEPEANSDDSALPDDFDIFDDYTNRLLVALDSFSQYEEMLSDLVQLKDKVKQADCDSETKAKFSTLLSASADAWSNFWDFVELVALLPGDRQDAKL